MKDKDSLENLIEEIWKYDTTLNESSYQIIHGFNFTSENLENVKISIDKFNRFMAVWREYQNANSAEKLNYDRDRIWAKMQIAKRELAKSMFNALGLPASGSFYNDSYKFDTPEDWRNPNPS